MGKSILRSALVAAGLLSLNACSGGPVDSSESQASRGAAMIGIGQSQQVIDERNVIVYVPTSYDGHKPLPLVMILHGFGGTAVSMVTSTHMNAKAASEGFIVVYLNGTKCDSSLGDPACQPGAEKLGFNSGIAPFLGINVDDVQFVRDIVSTMESELRIDEQRVYAAGFSNGGFMIHRLASELPDLLAATAVAEGTIGLDIAGDGEFDLIPEPRGSMPILIMHGTADTTIPYDGMKGGVNVCKSAEDAVDFWLEANRCHGSSETTTSGIYTTTSYAGCHANSDVVFISIEGGTHEWPPIATNASWSFFSDHSLTKH